LVWTCFTFTLSYPYRLNTEPLMQSWLNEPIILWKISSLVATSARTAAIVRLRLLPSNASLDCLGMIRLIILCLAREMISPCVEEDADCAVRSAGSSSMMIMNEFVMNDTFAWIEFVTASLNRDVCHKKISSPI
jgi:hypothetical protein